jgi:N-methylhydantoinase A/oxoprolinase/acetone carboxylase beta subunit
MVQAVDVHTVGQGGDSLVRLDAEHRILIGPRRVMPLCLLASMHPEIKVELCQQAVLPHHSDGQFVMALRPAPAGLSEEDLLLLQALAAGPCALRTLVEQSRYGLLVVRRVEALEARWLAARAAFTPTDALHVLGRFTRWDAEAAQLGAELLAAPLGLSSTEFCEQVVAGVSQRVAAELVSKALADEGLPHGATGEEGAAALLARALGTAPDSALGVSLTLRHPLVAIGAPAEAYLPRTASMLHTQTAIPPFSEVANAVGAAVGSVIQQLRVELRPLDSSGLYRLHLPDGVRDFPTLEEGVEHVRQTMPAVLEMLARQAGADQVELHVTRTDHFAPVSAGWGEELYLGTELTFVAAGRPSPAAGRA